MSGFHLIQDAAEECAACAAFALGCTTFEASGESSTPLCPRHFNSALSTIDY